MKPEFEIAVPQDSVGDEFVVVLSLLKEEGEYVSAGESLLEYETSKSVVTVEAPVSGYISFTCESDERVSIGAIVAALFAESAPQQFAEWKSSLAESNDVGSTRTVAVSPANSPMFSDRARALLEEYGLEESLFREKDFVSAQDVELLRASVSDLGERATSQVFDGEIERIVVIGANLVSSQMLQDIVDDAPHQQIIGYVNDSGFRAGLDLEFFDCEIFEFPEKVEPEKFDSVILAMGGSVKSMQLRKKIFSYYSERGVKFANLISSSATVSSSSEIGVGNIIEGNVYVAPHAKVGDNNFISYSVVVGHHASIGDHNLFAPGVMMAGLVTIANECIFPTGVNFSDKVRIGSRVVVPVGHNIVSSLPDDTVIKYMTKH